jgi:hypothetical protein
MIGKFTVGAGLWIALQFSAFEIASNQGKAVLAQAGFVNQRVQDVRCAQAQAFGLDDLRRAGLVIECN